MAGPIQVSVSPSAHDILRACRALRPVGMVLVITPATAGMLVSVHRAGLVASAHVPTEKSPYTPSVGRGGALTVLKVRGDDSAPSLPFWSIALIYTVTLS